MKPVVHKSYTAMKPFQEPLFSTLIELLQQRAVEQGDRPAYTFLNGDLPETSLSFKDLNIQVQTIAAFLQKRIAKGNHVLLLYPPGVDFIVAYLACLYAGVVAVPTYPPQSVRSDRSLPRIQAIKSDAQVVVALTTEAMLHKTRALFERAPDFRALPWIATDTIVPDPAVEWQDPEVKGETLAFLQYTSGSTGNPKGVMVTHANLLHNLRLLQIAHSAVDQRVFVNWLPLYHDMGLIGNVLYPLYLAAHTVLMSPVAFLQRPFRWLQAISQYKATTSGGPNFAYDMCARKITIEQQAELDLSSWVIAFNGAEPVRQETLERFAQTFAPCGFRREAFAPCYGLAEATLFVSGGISLSSPRYCHVDESALAQNRVVLNQHPAEKTKKLVSCGPLWLDQEVVIVNPDTGKPCDADQIGEIWISSPSVAQGYWSKLSETRRTFHAYLADGGRGPFLRTGDFGFMYEGELYITGRLKDLIIIRGRNLYPQDIELTVERCHEALRAGCGAAFSVDVEGEERLVIVQEVERQFLHADLTDVIATVCQVVAEQHEVQPYAVVCIKTGTLPKTSSGKIQHHLTRTQYLESTLEIVGVKHA